MIKFLLSLLTLVSIIHASKILSYNVYDRTDRVDVMITFDTPYEGKIKQNLSKAKIIIKLENAYIESSKIKTLSSKFLTNLTITPLANYTQIVASVPNSTILKASKTADAYGLRLRFKNKNATITTHSKTTKLSNSSLPTKKDNNISKRYYIVITILIIGIIILFYLRKKITPKNQSNKPNAWLFQQANSDASSSNTKTSNDVVIRFQKSIDEENSVVMLDFGKQSYLVLMGKSSILLDKFTDDKPANQDDFEAILQNRHQELDEYLKVENKQTFNNKTESLQAYQNAASILANE